MFQTQGFSSVVFGIHGFPPDLVVQLFFTGVLFSLVSAHHNRYGYVYRDRSVCFSHVCCRRVECQSSRAREHYCRSFNEIFSLLCKVFIENKKLAFFITLLLMCLAILNCSLRTLRTLFIHLSRGLSLESFYL